MVCSSEGKQPTDLLTPFKSMNTTTHGNDELLSEAVDQELTLDELQCVSGGILWFIPVAAAKSVAVAYAIKKAVD